MGRKLAAGRRKPPERNDKPKPKPQRGARLVKARVPHPSAQQLGGGLMITFQRRPGSHAIPHLRVPAFRPLRVQFALLDVWAFGLFVSSSCPLWCPLVSSFPSPLYVDRKSASFCAHPRCYLCSTRERSAARLRTWRWPGWEFRLNAHQPLTTKNGRRSRLANEPRLPGQEVHSLRSDAGAASRAKQNVYQRTQCRHARKCEKR